MHPASISHPSKAISLSLAMVTSFNAPLLLLDGDLHVIAASAAFCRAFDIAPGTTPGRLLMRLGDGEWATPQLTALLKATASGHAAIDSYQMDLKRDGRPTLCLAINARKIDYADHENVRLLVAVEDITDARAAEKRKDALVVENAALLQELQHRVANSLQIIASVLMQSARNVVSGELVLQAPDPNRRVISMAAVQEHLAPARVGDVKVRPYLQALCESIGASMIHDHAKVKIAVSGDDSVTIADTSISLGLVVTELVINALKHAFPDHRAGAISVDYTSRHTGWTLNVSDDGVGMPAGDTKAGLGTTIVRALAEQLNARVVLSDAAPGTSVSIVHADREDEVANAAV